MHTKRFFGCSNSKVYPQGVKSQLPACTVQLIPIIQYCVLQCVQDFIKVCSQLHLQHTSTTVVSATVS